MYMCKSQHAYYLLYILSIDCYHHAFELFKYIVNVIVSHVLLNAITYTKC